MQWLEAGWWRGAIGLSLTSPSERKTVHDDFIHPTVASVRFFGHHFPKDCVDGGWHVTAVHVLKPSLRGSRQSHGRRFRPCRKLGGFVRNA